MRCILSDSIRCRVRHGAVVSTTMVVVEPRSDRIAKTVGATIADKALTSRMSAIVWKKSREFTWRSFGTRFLSALSGMDRSLEMAAT